MSLTPGARLGAYEVTSPLGEGGMGQVWRARDTTLNRDVALKVLPDLFANDPDRLARFTREAHTLAALNHPNIAHIYGTESQALVMELVEGEDLSAHIARGPLALSDALPIARQIAEALEPIADLPGNFRGGAWGRDGVIVFGGNQGLMQVREAGGTPAVLLPLDPSRKGDELGMPRFLADGRHFVYARWPFDPARTEIYLGSLDRAQAPKRLDATGVVLGYAASPDPRVLYLLLGRPGSLMAQAFDTRRLEITGEAM